MKAREMTWEEKCMKFSIFINTNCIGDSKVTITKYRHVMELTWSELMKIHNATRYACDVRCGQITVD